MSNPYIEPTQQGNRSVSRPVTIIGFGLGVISFFILIWVASDTVYAPAMVLGDALSMNPELQYQFVGYSPTNAIYDWVTMGILGLWGGIIGFATSKKSLYGVLVVCAAALFFITMLNIANSLLLYDFQTDQLKHPRSYTD